MKQGTANLAEDYCFIHKALRPVGTARRQIAAVPPSNSRPVDIRMDRQRANVGMNCPILPQPCTHDDLEEFNPELDPAPSIGRE